MLRPGQSLWNRPSGFGSNVSVLGPPLQVPDADADGAPDLLVLTQEEREVQLLQGRLPARHAAASLSPGPLPRQNLSLTTWQETHPGPCTNSGAALSLSGSFWPPQEQGNMCSSSLPLPLRGKAVRTVRGPVGWCRAAPLPRWPCMAPDIRHSEINPGEFEPLLLCCRLLAMSIQEAPGSKLAVGAASVWMGPAAPSCTSPGQVPTTSFSPVVGHVRPPKLRPCWPEAAVHLERQGGRRWLQQALTAPFIQGVQVNHAGSESRWQGPTAQSRVCPGCGADVWDLLTGGLAVLTSSCPVWLLREGSLREGDRERQCPEEGRPVGGHAQHTPRQAAQAQVSVKEASPDSSAQLLLQAGGWAVPWTLRTQPLLLPWVPALPLSPFSSGAIHHLMSVPGDAGEDLLLVSSEACVLLDGQDLAPRWTLSVAQVPRYGVFLQNREAAASWAPWPMPPGMRPPHSGPGQHQPPPYPAKEKTAYLSPGIS